MALHCHTISRENDVLPDPQGNLIVTIQVSFLLRRLRRGEGERRGMEASQASLLRTMPRGLAGPWNLLLNSYEFIKNLSRIELKLRS